MRYKVDKVDQFKQRFTYLRLFKNAEYNYDN